ncbi:MAG: hemerythrin domain-containing protein [Candidatus Aminicenantales bacterium]
MLPIGPLMIEHRLIERMIRVMKTQLELIETANKADPGVIERIAHFIKAYADRCHHGKEEDILFRRLAEKKLSPEHKRVLEELVEEHKLGRQFVLSMKEANRRYQKGEKSALPIIADGLRSLMEFYPEHIRKEDQDFFIPIMDYFSPEEKDAMIRDGYELDSRLIHEEYENLVRMFDVAAVTASAE